MAFTSITSTDEVRAVLGVSPLELTDAVLGSPIYTTNLTEALYALHPQLAADYAAVDRTAPSADQERFVNLTEAYAAYQVAQQCLGSVQMFAPQLIKDTKTEVQRTQDAYKNLRRDVGATLSILRMSLLTVYPKINPDAVAPSAQSRLMVLSAGIASDPVTAG